MGRKKLTESLNYAIMGIVQCIKRERNMQIHIIIAVLVIIFSLMTNVSKLEFILVIFAISMVFITEMINTAMEKTLDAIINYTHPLVKVAKDISAGAVLIAAINAMIVGYIVFWQKVKPFTRTIIETIKNSNPHIVFMSLVIVVVLTIIMKLYTKAGTPLKGGLPSGHSAIAFSIATIIAYYARELFVIVLCYALALLVAQSRVDSEVHSLLEVILGAALGSLTTMLILLLIR
ncbi:diacylglycerol kinase (ATP) [Hathewaya proteolytica DSM 3090]|uniref:Diacylglycerol kinase (ATP) n=1 Tax=Hathewaya proteolytica DSM 3090 TaxID=1121331 RepID=A0A1M6JFN6_9CLOT|nr:diacylglycerol kinase [Hathewaya proteolytica]SHJ45475.1 diacylglycerol kinase (ATP) [Hathewaya proteolytica DSM 3090]